MNQLRGEVELKAGDDTYRLRLGINSIVEVETVLDRGISEVIQHMDRVGTLRALLWGAMLEYQPKTTLFEAGDLIGRIGAEAAAEKLAEALKLAFPQPEPNTPLN